MGYIISMAMLNNQRVIISIINPIPVVPHKAVAEVPKIGNL